MGFTYLELVSIGFKAGLLGLALGLIIRILRTKIPLKYILQAVYWAIMTLVLFPFILFPVVVSRPKYKKEIIQLMADSIYSHHKELSIREIKRKIKENWSWRLVLSLWLVTVKYVSSNYDEYVEFNMNAIKEKLLLKSEHRSSKIKISVLSNQSKMFEDYGRSDLCGF